jgi:hypothetical protein
MTSQDSVRSTFNYTRDTGVTPEIYFYEPLPGTQTHQPGDDPREMTVHDGWDRARSFSLNREGFALREFHSSFQDWDNDDAIKARLRRGERVRKKRGRRQARGYVRPHHPRQVQ